jgi:glycosyltransferase involved in cell wall biosynthesis
LYDYSSANPYLWAKNEQLDRLQKLGVTTRLVEYQHSELVSGSGQMSHLGDRVCTLFSTRRQVERLFPWVRLRQRMEAELLDESPDAIFCYHFDALSAVYQTRVAPIVAGVGDLWHLPAYFRWVEAPRTMHKYLVGWPRQLLLAFVSRRIMSHMLIACQRKGAFAAHYASWLRGRNGLHDTKYFRTPVHDPSGEDWRQKKSAAQSVVPQGKIRLLMIGEVNATATNAGFRLLRDYIVPRLDKELGRDKYELHVVGGGLLAEEFQGLAQHSAVRFRGKTSNPDDDFLAAHVLLVPNPISLGIRVRIIAAFSYGCCVVTHTANRLGIPEIEHERNALVGMDAETLSREVIRAASDVRLRSQVEQGARATFEQFFSEPMAAGEIVTAIEAVGGSF